MKIALLGAGRIGQLHADNVLRHPGAELAWVVDVDEDVGRGLAGRTGARFAARADQALADSEVEGVLICTSTNTHVDLIESAAAHGKAIFCEKPLDLALDRADRALAAVQQAGVPFMIGFNRRFDPHFRSLKQAMDAGVVGRPEIVKITSRDPAPPPLDYIRVSGGLFRDMMIHDLDMARFILPEEPVEVLATGSCLVDPAISRAGDVDTAMVILRTASGILCHIDNSRRAAYGYDQRVEVLGARGMLQVENPRPRTLVTTTEAGALADKPPYFFLERYARAYQAELDHFIDAVDQGLAPEIAGSDGRQALVLADACMRSMSEGRFVSVAPSEEMP